MHVIDQLDVVAERRIGGEEQRHVDTSRIEGLMCDSAARVERDDLVERHPVAFAESDQAQRAVRAFRWTTEHQLVRHRRQIAQCSQVVAKGGVT